MASKTTDKEEPKKEKDKRMAAKSESNGQGTVAPRIVGHARVLWVALQALTMCNQVLVEPLMRGPKLTPCGKRSRARIWL